MATAFEQVKAMDAFGSPADVTADLLGWLGGSGTVPWLRKPARCIAMIPSAAG